MLAVADKLQYDHNKYRYGIERGGSGVGLGRRPRKMLDSPPQFWDLSWR